MKGSKNSAARSEAFRRIKAGLDNALGHAEGRKIMNMREVELPDAPKAMSPAQITALRVKVLRVSQHVFARMINASPQTIQAWEQGRAKPSGPALRFLRIIQERPEVVTRPSAA